MRRSAALLSALFLGAPLPFLHAQELHLINQVPPNRHYINEVVGATALYDAGFYGQQVMIANVEAGHVWGDHEVFDRTALGLPNNPTVKVHGAGALGELDFHATAVAHVLVGAKQDSTGININRGTGIAWGAELRSGAIATQFNANGNFSLTYTSMAYAYNVFFNGDGTGKKADVINSSWGGADPSGNGPLSKIMDGFAAMNSSVASVVAAGNSGPTTRTVNGVGGYNGIVVGSVGGASFLTPSEFSSVGPADFYNPVTGTTVANVRAPVHLAAPGEQQVLALYTGSEGGGSQAGVPTLNPPPTNAYAAMDGTSFSSPVVAGSVALLKDASKGTAAHIGKEESAMDSRVIRSVLMAGTVATEGWNNGQTKSGNIIGTTQALDYTTGAGALNLSRSATTYLNGTSDVVGLGGGIVQSAGWDFGNIALGGRTDYIFDTLLSANTELTISLNWFYNRTFDADTLMAADLSLADLDLEVWRLDDGNFSNLVAFSSSDYNNSEFLRFNLEQEGNYAFRVFFSDVVFERPGAELLSESYGVAWYTTPIPEPSSWVLLGVAALAFGAIMRRKPTLLRCRS